MLWAEKEYYWDSDVTKRQKTSSEFAQDIKKFIEPYSVRSVYVDPSAAHFRLDLQRLGIHPVNADNDVNNGIAKVTSEMKDGKLFICEDCPNLIREIEGYVWHPKCKERGEDEPLKQNDHAVDALRYAIHTHKPVTYNAEAEKAKKDAEIRKNMSSWNHPNHYGFR
jgi:phage terminase large subunit